MTLVLILLLSATGGAQSVLNLPRVVSGPEVFSGIAVSNPSNVEASVTFNAFQPDGTSLSPATVRIPASGQYARQFSEIFGFTGVFNGWVQATSGQKGLTGFFLNSNSAVTDLDGAAVADPTPESILPFVSEANNAKTEITALNPNGESATVTFTLFAADGKEIGSNEISLSGRSLVRQTLTNLFPTADRTAASYVRVRSDRAISTHEVVADYRVANTTLGRESAALAGIRATDDKAYVLSQFVTGGGWLSVVGVVNAAGIDQDLTITAFAENGQKLDFPSNPRRLTLTGNASLRASVSDLFGITATDLKTGWIEVRGSIGRLVTFVGSGNTITPSFATVPGIGAGAASRFQVYSQVSEGGGFFSGLTLVNPATAAASVEFFVLNADGTTVGKSTFSIPANGRSGRLFSELVPASFSQTGGWVFVRSSQPLVGAELFGSTNGASLATVPSQSSSDFQPPAQVAASVSGAVRTVGAGVGNVVVTMTGPVTATKTTDPSGRFNFAQLPKGDYKISASAPLLTIAPAERTITVGADNITDLAFEAAGGSPSPAPAVSFITPGSTLVGNSTLNLRVLGSNFAPTSVVRLNNVPVQTNFIDSTELQAVVPSTMMRVPADVSVRVVTPEPGGGSSSALLLLVAPVSSNPLIEGRVTVGSFPSGVAIHPARQIAVVSNQSSDNVSIIDLKTLKVTGEIKVGRSPAEGVAIHAARDLALVANTGAGTVSVIDLVKNVVVETIVVENSPVSVAINPVTNRALVANLGSDSVSVIDLETLKVVGKIAVSGLPSAIAINPLTNVAVVTRRSNNDITLIDLKTNSVLGNIPVGRYPRAVAVNAARNIAVVANANAATVSIVDLTTRTVLGTVGVGAGPTAVAIHAQTNNAVISNSGFCLASCKNLEGLPATVSIINIDQREVLDTVTVGSTAFGVDIDADNQRAVVVNYGSSDATVVRIPNPKPRIGGIEPKTFPSGGGAVTITIRGSGFVPTSVVTLNGRTLITTYVSNVELKAIIPADLVAQLLTPSPIQRPDSLKGGKASGFAGAFGDTFESTFNIGVSSPGPGGGDAPPPSDPATNQLLPENKPAVLWSISPSETTADVRQVDITLNGNNFNTTTRVNLGSAAFAPVSVSPTSLTITVPGSALTPGTYAVTATNPAPGGGGSSSKSFTVQAAANPVPVIRSITPGSVTAGSPDASFAISGSGFMNLTTVTVGGQPVSATATPDTLQFTVPASLFASTSGLPVLVSTPAPGGGSAGTSISVLNPAPVVTGILPSSTNAGADSVAIAVTGSQFTSSSQIVLEGTPIATVFVNSTRLLGTIPGAILRRAGPLQVFVENSPPGGGRTSGGVFNVNAPFPVLTTLNPSKIRTSKTETAISLVGTGFLSNSRVLVNNTAVVSATDSSTQITATIPPVLLTKGATLNVAVENPAPGGQSAVLPLSVENPVPTVDRVTPASIRADQDNVTLNVFGKDFAEGAVILLGTTRLTTTLVSDLQLSAPLPTVVPLGVSPLTVVNPTPGGGTSTSVPFEVLAAVPRITSVTPSIIGSGQTIRVAGANFGRGTTATVGTLPAAVTVQSATELTLVVPADVPVGNTTIVLRNPPNLDSQAFAVQVANPVPAIDSLTPDSMRAAEPFGNFTLKGSGFVASSVVKVDGTNVFTQYGDNTTLRFVFTAPAAPATLKVTVFNGTPGGGTSNAMDLKILSPVPMLSYLSPADVYVQGGNAEVLVVGSGFIQGATIQVNGSAIATTFVSADAVRGSIPASAVGTYSVKVVNPGGVESNELPFVVNSPPSNPAPSISTITPASVSANVATVLTVTGSGFMSGASVTINGVPATYTVTSDAEIRVNAPALAVGTHTLMVVNPGPGGGNASKTFTAGITSVNLRVRLRDATTGLVISSATIVVNGVSLVTDVNGFANFPNVPLGNKAISISKAGFIGRSFNRVMASSQPNIVLRVFPSSSGPDSDGDGLPNAVETNTRIFLSITSTGTDPNVADTDGDGLSDGAEVLDGVDNDPIG